MADAIRVTGLAEFQRAIKTIDAELPKALRVALNDAANVIVGYARPKVPKRTGRAARSVKAKSTRTQARVSGGGGRAPYYPWLDFGGAVGRHKSVRRPFLKDGRYIYAGYFAKRATFVEALEKSLQRVVESAGLELD